MGSPQDLKLEQVTELAEKNDGKPVESLQVKIKSKQPFIKEVNLRENDVCMVTLEKIK